MHFLLYWTPPYARDAVSEQYVLASLGSYHLRRVSAGDTVWVVSAPKGQLRLIGRMQVDTLVPTRDGFRAYAPRGAAEVMRDVPLHFAAVGALRFLGTERDRLDVADGRVSAMQLQTMRNLSAASARLLARHWLEKPAPTSARRA